MDVPWLVFTFLLIAFSADHAIQMVFYLYLKYFFCIGDGFQELTTFPETCSAG